VSYSYHDIIFLTYNVYPVKSFYGAAPVGLGAAPPGDNRESSVITANGGKLALYLRRPRRSRGVLARLSGLWRLVATPRATPLARGKLGASFGKYSLRRVDAFFDAGRELRPGVRDCRRRRVRVGVYQVIIRAAVSPVFVYAMSGAGAEKSTRFLYDMAAAVNMAPF
jgi:hypothetical protein